MDKQELEARKQLSIYLESAKDIYSYLNYMGYETDEDKEEVRAIYLARWRQYDLTLGVSNG